MNENLIQKVETFVKTNIKEEIAHDYAHLDRVRNWALVIAKKERYQYEELVEIAAMLHDIGLGNTENRKDHGEIGAQMARDLLEKELSKENLEMVTDAIRNHDKISKVEKPSKLLQIVMDADTLELLGAIGIARAFSSKANTPFYNKTNTRGDTWKLTSKDFDKRFAEGKGIGTTILDQLNFQISCYDLLQTKAAKKLAKPLKRYTLDFIRQLEKELN